MVELADTGEAQSLTDAESSSLWSEEHLADRCMFLKEFDLLDIDHGHFWHKLSWHGVHVEFPSRVHHYEPNLYERQIRDNLLSLPVDILEDAYQNLQDRPTHMVCHGDHCFVFEWDHDVQRHLHCYYERSEQGREADRRARERYMQTHVEQYERNRQFPSKRLNAELEMLKNQRAKAQKVVEAWDRLILDCQERIAADEVLHLGHATPVAP